jgi:hypothetical protein
MGCLLVLFFGDALTHAQQKKQKSDSASLTRKILSERDRETLHEHLPVELIGIEEGDNQFRNATPALMKCNRTKVELDMEDFHARKLAMYEEGASFHTPLLNSANIGHGSVKGSGQAKHWAVHADEAASNPWVYIVPGGFCFILVALILHQRGLLFAGKKI